MDGTAQLFDPWGTASPVAGSGALKVLKSAAVSLENPIQPPKTSVRGVAASGNGVYFTTVRRYVCMMCALCVCVMCVCVMCVVCVCVMCVVCNVCGVCVMCVVCVCV